MHDSYGIKVHIISFRKRFLISIEGNRKQILTRTESHQYEVNTLGILACNFSMFLRFLKGIHFRKSLTDSEWSDRFLPGKSPKVIQLVSYSIRYCRILLLIRILSEQ